MDKRLGSYAIPMILVFMLVIGGSFIVTTDPVDAAIEGDYEYTTSGSPTVATITGYTGAGGAITIPDVLGGYPVVAINDSAFYICYSLTSVVIPDSVKTIGNETFCGCNAMTSVTIGDHVISIGKEAFRSCHHLTSLIIPDRVTSIEDRAFENCYAMTSLTLGSGVRIIGSGAFTSDPLTSVTIPSGVIFIGVNAFSNCNLMTSIDVAPSNVNYASVDGVLYDKNITALIQCPASKIGTLTIPSSVTSIGNYSFNYCSLNSIFIPDSVTSIGMGAFYMCNHLTSITIPSNVRTVGYNLFYSCSALSSVTFASSNNLIRIGSNAFDHCTNLTSITIPESVYFIDQYAFSFCTNLTSIIIPDNVTFIGPYAFDHCTNLTSITIPDRVTTIYSQTFNFCTNLTSVVIGNGVVGIYSMAFRYCSSMTSITIPSSVNVIGGYLFQFCSALTSIIFTGLVAPTSVDEHWVFGTLAGIRGHAYTTSNFPAPGNDFHGLMMGLNIPLTSPGIPKKLTAIGGVAKVFLTWSAPSETGGSNITGYNVYRSLTSGGLYSLISSPSELNLTDTGLTNGQIYWYKVSAENAMGEGANCTAVNATPSSVITVPGAPQNLALDKDNNTVDVTWQAPISDGGSTIIGYRLYRSTSAHGMYVLIASPSGLNYTDTGLVNGTSYFYKVSAVNAIGEGANCTEVGTYIHTNEPTVPGNPEGLTAIANDTEVVLTWSAPISDGGSPITSYQLYRSTTSDGTYALIASPSGLNFTDTGLTKGHTYWYKISALNAVGEGANCSAIAVDIPSDSSSSDNTMLIIGAVIAIVAVLAIVVFLFLRRRK
ncbi:MAG: leucine-rich repeat protein [Methanomassiliicoccales archaeon]|nr:leucine-rich repeat protein [Methanomassiliicoccales archaeon]